MHVYEKILILIALIGAVAVLLYAISKWGRYVNSKFVILTLLQKDPAEVSLYVFAGKNCKICLDQRGFTGFVMRDGKMQPVVCDCVYKTINGMSEEQLHTLLDNLAKFQNQPAGVVQA